MFLAFAECATWPVPNGYTCKIRNDVVVIGAGPAGTLAAARAGNTSSTAVEVPFDMGGSLNEEISYAVREYASEEHAWTQPTTGTGAAMRLATAQIGSGGFRLLSFERYTP